MPRRIKDVLQYKPLQVDGADVAVGRGRDNLSAVKLEARDRLRMRLQLDCRLRRPERHNTAFVTNSDQVEPRLEAVAINGAGGEQRFGQLYIFLRRDAI